MFTRHTTPRFVPPKNQNFENWIDDPVLLHWFPCPVWGVYYYRSACDVVVVVRWAANYYYYHSPMMMLAQSAAVVASS